MIDMAKRRTLEQMSNDSNGDQGLRCPKCNGVNFTVYKTRQGSNFCVRRERICRACGHKFLTYERALGR